MEGGGGGGGGGINHYVFTVLHTYVHVYVLNTLLYVYLYLIHYCICRIGVFFFIATNQAFGSLSAIDLFIKQRALFMYGVSQ